MTDNLHRIIALRETMFGLETVLAQLHELRSYEKERLGIDVHGIEDAADSIRSHITYLNIMAEDLIRELYAQEEATTRSPNESPPRKGAHK